MVFLLQLAAVLAAGLFVAPASPSSLAPRGRPPLAGRDRVRVCANRLLEPLAQSVESFRAERIQSRSFPTEPDFFFGTSSYRVVAALAAVAFAALLEVVLSARSG